MLIAVLPYTRSQTLPLNTLEFTRIRVAALPYTSFFLPSRSSHTLASKPTALEYPRFHAHCCPPVNSFLFPSRPGGAAAAPQTLDSLHFLICTRSVHAQARLSACARLKQRDHAVVPAGRRGGESDEEDGAAWGGTGLEERLHGAAAGSPVKLFQASLLFHSGTGCTALLNEQTYTPMHRSRAWAGRECGLFK